MKKLLLLALLALSASAMQCPARSGVKKITVATGPCFGRCARTATAVDRELNIQYFGGQFSKQPGYFEGKVSQATWNELVLKLEAIRYQQLDTLYRQSVDDQAFEIVLHYGNERKHIRAQQASLPPDVNEVFTWIAGLHKTQTLQPADAARMKFETTIQGPAAQK